MVRPIAVLSICIMASLLLGCSPNPEVRSARADAAIQEQKAEIMKDYRACLKKYDRPEEETVCERYMKAIEVFDLR